MARLRRYVLAALAAAFCSSGTLTAADPAKKSRESVVESSSVGDTTRVTGMDSIKVEGLGLVVGLPGTGGEPPPGPYRDKILDLMRKREVEKPQELLASKSVSVVILRGFIPPGIRKGEAIDVEAYVTPNDANTVSIRGGYLLKSDLREVAATRQGAQLDGKKWASVDGPLMVVEAPSGKKDEAALKFGRVLGRGVVNEDRDFALTMTKENKSSRLTRDIANHVNARFRTMDERGKPELVATAKTDRWVDLKLPLSYRQNYQRFLLVVRRIPIRINEPGIQRLMEEYRKDITIPGKAYETALGLEALGPKAVTILKEALSSESQIVRFSAAEALSYIGDSRGSKELGDCVEREPLYRPYALAALTANDMPAARMRLLRLMQSLSPEARYGAFRALWTVDKTDPVIGGEKLGSDEFYLHVVPSGTDPMVHVARHFRPEIVLFGENQKMMAPMLIRVGDVIAWADEHTPNKVWLAAYKPGAAEQRLEATANVADVVRKASLLGMRYPDVVELLKQAAEKHNLEGRLEINALPRATNITEMVRTATREEREALDLPTGLPSMFQEGGRTSEAPKTVAAQSDEEREKEEKDKAQPKKSMWRKIFMPWAAN